jgi:hypothetical protein
MTVTWVTWLFSSSRHRGSFGCGLSDQWIPPAVVGRWLCIAMLSIVFVGQGSVARPAGTGAGEQAGSTPGPDTGRLVAEFHQDFRGGEYDHRALMLMGGNAEKFVQAKRGGLIVRIPAGLDKPAAVGIAPRFLVHGDFEITATCAIVQADKPIRGYGVAAALWVETDTPTEEAVTVERGIIPREGERFTSTRISGPQEARKYDVRRARAQSRSGKIRMARMGSKVTTSFADGDKPFRVLRTVELGTEDLTLVRLGADTGVSDHALEILVEDLIIRAEALPGLPEPRPTPGGSPGGSRPTPRPSSHHSVWWFWW